MVQLRARDDAQMQIKRLRISDILRGTARSDRPAAGLGGSIHQGVLRRPQTMTTTIRRRTSPGWPTFPAFRHRLDLDWSPFR